MTNDSLSQNHSDLSLNLPNQTVDLSISTLQQSFSRLRIDTPENSVNRHPRLYSQFSASRIKPGGHLEIVPYPPPQLGTLINASPGFSFQSTPSSAMEDDHISSQMLQQTLTSLDNRNPNDVSPYTIMCVHQNSAPIDPPEEDVSEDFVTECNKHIGNEENLKKAQRLINKMRLLGNLEPGHKGQRIDIPAARRGLCMLALLDSPIHKTQALDSLQLLLNNDPLDKSNGTGLVGLAIQLLHIMNRNHIQRELVDIQIKIAEVYNSLMTLLLRHYAKNHTNAITDDLKIELISASQTLESLNRQENPRLTYLIKSALEGARRLKDDKKLLFDVLARFYHAAAAATAAGYSLDMKTCYAELAKTFKDLDPHLSHSWYNGVVIINDLGKQALTDQTKLDAILILIRDKYRKLNWKFTYAALEVLTNIVINGTTDSIRRKALLGVKQIELPGLQAFAKVDNLPTHTTLKPIARCALPYTTDFNSRIRQACAEQLVNISDNAPDQFLRAFARKILVERAEMDDDPYIVNYLYGLIPIDDKTKQVWLLG